MARGVFSTSNHFVYAGGLITATPLTIACWINPASIGATIVPMGLFYTSGANAQLDGWDIYINPTTGYPSASTGDGTAVNNSTKSVSVTVAAWNHLAAVFASATSRLIYLNGSAGTLSETSRVPSTAPNKSVVGCVYLQNNAKAVALNGYIGEVGFWNVALTDAEILQLAAGYSPLFVRPESLVAYYPLIRGDSSGDEPDLMAGAKMVEQGTVAVATHPRVFYPAAPIFRWDNPIFYPSVTIAPTSASAVGANLGPTVNLGSLLIAPTAAGAVASRLGPTVKLSSLSIAPTPASSIGSRTNPNTLLGSIIISPAPAAAIAAYANPTVVIEGEEAAVIKDQTYFLFWSVMFRKKKRRNNRIVYVKK